MGRKRYKRSKRIRLKGPKKPNLVFPAGIKLESIENCLKAEDYFEPFEIALRPNILRKKGAPLFHWRPEFNKYVDFKSIIKAKREAGITIPRKRREVKKKTKGHVRLSIRSVLGRSTRYTRALKENDNVIVLADYTQALLDFISLPKNTVIWDPHCRFGHVPTTLKLNGFNRVISTDKYETGYGTPGVDFLIHRFTDYDWIICAPPPSKLQEWIVRAWKYKKPFAFFVKTSLWNYGTRRELFIATKPTHFLPLTWRSSYFVGDKEHRGRGTIDYAWCVWSPNTFKRPINEPLMSEDFTTEFFPLTRPESYPKLDLKGKLIEPFLPLLSPKEKDIL